jgi:large subunit ribosomal protein L9
MKVILQKDISNLGDAGDIKEVADGYARNYLLPKKMVLKCNEASKKAIDHQNKLIKIKKEKRKKQSEKVSEVLKSLEIKISAKAGEENKLFGSVTAMDVSKALQKQGHVVDKRKIMLDEPIKELGEHQVLIKLDEGLTSTIKVVVEKE